MRRGSERDYEGVRRRSVEGLEVVKMVSEESQEGVRSES